MKYRLRTQIDAAQSPTPCLGLDAKKEENRRKKQYQNNADDVAMVHHMDENVGRLLGRLDELRLSDNTTVIFTSDNGGKGSVTSRTT
jgi:arylsulfatase A-like enzyme